VTFQLVERAEDKAFHPGQPFLVFCARRCKHRKFRATIPRIFRTTSEVTVRGKLRTRQEQSDLHSALPSADLGGQETAGAMKPVETQV
jgi:hypothetical protein